MRIVSWNCAGGFCSISNAAGYPKYKQILESLNPDILLLQECEHQDKFVDEMKSACKSWFGFSHEDRPGTRARIVGVCVLLFSDDIEVEPIEFNRKAKFIQPLSVKYKGQQFNLINTWVNTAHFHDWDWKLFSKFIKQRETVIMGDFNWPSTSASPLFKSMEEYKLKSLYHKKTGEVLGEESQMTNRARSRSKKEYFIDYCFIPKEWINNVCFDIENSKDWIDARFSDHCPLVLDIDKYKDVDYRTDRKTIKKQGYALD